MSEDKKKKRKSQKDSQAQEKHEKAEEGEAKIASVSASRYRDVCVEAGAEEEAEPPALWLVTFTDVMALMLTFFVMTYSMSVPKEEDWEQMASSMTVGLNKFESPKWYQGPQDTINIDKLDFSRALDLSYLNALVNEIIEKDEKLQDVVVIQQKDRLILSLPTELLFESGQAEVNVSGKRALFSLGDPLSRIRNRIEIIGHTDPTPVSGGGQYSSNWELSLSRAANVASVLENVGYVRPIIVRGLSSGRYDELPANMSTNDRLSYARRVDVVIMKDDGSQRFLMSVN